MWFAGIDWADDHHDVVVIDADGHPVGTRRVPHTPAGLNDPTRRISLTSLGAGRKEEVACIVETIHGLLIAALLPLVTPSILSTPRRSIASVAQRAPKPISSMRICWPNTGVPSSPICGAWNLIATGR